ncbi:putative maltase H [Trachymyrmex septentrionalis]|uniref:Putative maltase H n=1 Tax=Trachymyrmex septentrionalis TaxID=34720 RepID=A0A151JXV7_9HYME|nr:putative maltase H [Trachymyrmex septentrionalis]
MTSITSKLNYLKESGIGAIWLLPINRSSMVILDLVPNHSSDEHYWFQVSLNRTGKYDHYTDLQGFVVGQLRVISAPVFCVESESELRIVPSHQGFKIFEKQWYFHQFHWQSDLNYSNLHVREEIRIKHIICVDGFRIDAVPHLFETNSNESKSNIKCVSKDDYNYLIHTLTKDQPQTYDLVQNIFFSIFFHILSDDEAYTSLENTIKYYNYGSHIPFNFNFIINMMRNHDRNRTASRFPRRTDQMTMLAMILPGMAVTYYG